MEKLSEFDPLYFLLVQETSRSMDLLIFLRFGEVGERRTKYVFEKSNVCNVSRDKFYPCVGLY